ncbi:beta-1,3-glucan-binding protein-like [Thrips palmi]|uniref:Beta-1,3-glucan-binding protein-like n=1 Tax=Thrips palmi TaxID=161013 RepID=A0A6P8ZMN3_THRPL|nr:beta-1,3-glucan-binding protein-like [Thrips palmi]
MAMPVESVPRVHVAVLGRAGWRLALQVAVVVVLASCALAYGEVRPRRQSPWRSPPGPPGFRRGGPWRDGPPGHQQTPPGLRKQGAEQGFRDGEAEPGFRAPGGEGFRAPGGEGFRKQEGGAGAPRQQDCAPSLTTMNGGQPTCSGQLIFEDNFNDLEQWSNDIHMAGPPDYEFVVYKSSPWNIYIDNGIMTIKAFLSEDKYGPGFVSNGTMFVKRCTASDRDLCERTAFSYNILPPVRSARVHTANSFAFRYGVVEMRVRGPRGDWLYPQLALKPAESRYGPHFSSGEIRLPSHFGNKFLRDSPGGGQAGGSPGQRGWRGRKLMRAGVALGVKDQNDAKLLSVEARAPQEVADWSRVFHVVRMKWSPDGFEYWVDGESMGRKIAVPEGGFASLSPDPAKSPWAGGEKNAPFDQEFYMSIGLGVGGLNRFPDNVTNGQNAEFPKPWKNTSPKAMLNFWKAKDQWYPTWQLPLLQVSYAKVWAL